MYGNLLTEVIAPPSLKNNNRCNNLKIGGNN